MRIHIHTPAAMLKVTGDDAASFLQGQFTNELRQPVGAVVYGLWLNQKGRVLADSQVLRMAENEFLVLSVSSPVMVIQSRLEEYVVADDVVLTNETAHGHGLALSGDGCGEAIRQLLGAVPPSGQFSRSGNVLVFAGRRVKDENYELIGPGEIIADMQRKFFAAGGSKVAAEEMEYARITDRIPAVPQDIGPGDLPNEGGLEDIAISYTKGCYLGQEVMARLKNLGQVRRRLRLIRGPGAPPPALAALYQGARKAGQVRSVATGENDFVALAMLSLLELDPAAGLSLTPDTAPVAQMIPHG